LPFAKLTVVTCPCPWLKSLASVSFSLPTLPFLKKIFQGEPRLPVVQ